MYTKDSHCRMNKKESDVLSSTVIYAQVWMQVCNQLEINMQGEKH